MNTSGTAPKPRPGKPLFIRLDAELHTALKIVAAEKETTITAIVEGLIRDYLEDKRKG